MAEEKKKEEIQEKSDDVIPGTEVAAQKPVSEVIPPLSEIPNQINIDVDAATAVAIKVQEFDKNITELEAQVADMKRQKATYIYESNIQKLIKQAQQRQAK